MTFPAVHPVRLFQATHSLAMEAAALDVLRSGQIASGAYVAQFEEAIGQLVGSAHVVAVDNMTNALTLALHLAGVGPGDEVLTLAFSCMSSNSAITRVGAMPVWVDMSPETAAMELDSLQRAITPKTKALTLYHVAGYPAPVEEIAAICRLHGIALIEDCNAALGAEQDGLPIGRFGDFAVYSFYPNRQINAIEGGALVCANEETAARARRLRRFGIDLQSFRDSSGEINAASDIPEVGISASFGNLNAALGLAQMDGLAARISRTRANAFRLIELLADVEGVQAVLPLPGAVPAFWGCLVLIEERDARLSQLKSAGVQASRLHYRNDRYSGFHAKARALQGTDRFMDQIVALPCGWWLSDDQIGLAAAVLRQS